MLNVLDAGGDQRIWAFCGDKMQHRTKHFSIDRNMYSGTFSFAKNMNNCFCIQTRPTYNQQVRFNKIAFAKLVSFI